MAEKQESVEATVRTIRRVTRKKYSAEEKVRIVLEGLRGETSVAALCRRERIPSNLYSRRTPRSPPPGMLREAASPGPTGQLQREAVCKPRIRQSRSHFDPTSCFPQRHSWGWRPTGPSFHTVWRVVRRSEEGLASSQRVLDRHPTQ